MSECEGGEMMVPRRFSRSSRWALAAGIMGVVATVITAVIGFATIASVGIKPAQEPYMDPSASAAWVYRQYTCGARIGWAQGSWIELVVGPGRHGYPVRATVDRRLPRWSLGRTNYADANPSDAKLCGEIGVGFPLVWLTGHRVTYEDYSILFIGYTNYRYKGRNIVAPTRVRFGRFLGNVLFFSTLAYALIGALASLRARRRARRVRCRRCGYNLQGLASGACPECGKPFSAPTQDATASTGGQWPAPTRTGPMMASWTASA